MSPPPRRILLIEDDDAVREALAELLTAEGYRVSGAANGREALERAEEEGPALILLDLCMPVMDGCSFRAAQLTDPRLASVPTVVLTASHVAERSALAGLGFAAVLSKPVEFERLMQLVRRYVEAPRTRVAAAVAASAVR